MGNNSKNRGETKTKEYWAYKRMFKRCFDKNYEHKHRYSGRGITICERWLSSYQNFLSDMGRAPSPNHTLDRIKNDLGYSPSNCRWATWEEQQNNRSSNRLLTFQGETLTQMQWALKTGIPRSTIKARLKMGWSLEEALTRPVKKVSNQSISIRA